MSPLDVAAVFAVLLVVVIGAFLVLATYNSVVTLDQQASKAWANIDVALKQRYDELPNLVEAVRDLMAYEQETLTRVTRLRTAYSPTEPIPAQAATSEATSSAVRQLFAVVERYPEIKVRAYDAEGRKVSRRYLDFAARVVQHEMDHIDGKLIVDYDGSVFIPKKRQDFFEKFFQAK